jgi:hypothetical protein
MNLQSAQLVPGSMFFAAGDADLLRCQHSRTGRVVVVSAAVFVRCYPSAFSTNHGVRPSPRANKGR